MTLQFGRNLAWRLKFIALVSQTALLAQLATAQPVADVEPKVVVPPPAAPLPFDLSIYGGGTFFSAKTALGLAANPLDVPNKSPAFGLRGTLLLLDGRLGVEAEVEDAMYKLRSGAGSGSVYGIRGHGLWYFMTEGPVRPFALLGVGEEFMVSKEKACQKDGSGAFAKDSSGGFLPAGCLFIATPSRNFAFEIGAGAKIPLTYRLALRLDARYMPMSGRPADPAHGTAAAGIVSNFTANLGLSWTFGGEPEDTDRDRIADDMDRCPNEAEDKDGYQDEDGCPEVDNDGDGILDINDKCPNDAEDKDGFQDTDGCPEPDNDGDGILDAKDKCPNEPETKNGFQDEDGCPDVADSDGDGIPDNLDKCPNVKEDKDGYQDQDGCPDLDNDNDQIPDVKDKCPDKPETKNGFKDDDGCPDEIPPAAAKVLNVALTSIEFKAALLQKSSDATLEALLELLLEHETVKLSVTVDSDAAGDDGAQLADLRAKAIAAWFAGSGIEAGRISAAVGPFVAPASPPPKPKKSDAKASAHPLVTLRLQ